MIILILTLIFSSGMTVKGQFNTILDQRNKMYEKIQNPQAKTEAIENKEDAITQEINESVMEIDNPDSLQPLHEANKYTVRKKHLDYNKNYNVFPDLTLNNLLKEIRKNGIKHEKVVLVQAILETGWFTSSVCRNKKNLFGLTNPRTGDYYEFERWQDSVKAYYTKVQYKYKGGNYLLWLDRLPYATRTTYIESLIRLLKQYFI
ncbi:MAG: glucosaminidase domain-containing protein [Muribaculum sp.]|nr:glucosaminidase domain-containing protein [Muribaculum sp.]